MAGAQRIRRPERPMSINRAFTQFANMVSRIAGRSWAFMACIAFVLVWAATGPAFGFSDTWQLVINTSTTIITFLMVFLIQNTQNRDNAAIQAKLDELILISEAENRYIGIERLTDKELEAILEQVEETAGNGDGDGKAAKTVARRRGPAKVKKAAARAVRKRA
jgi:low affinity Fe/Cu permease